jgi:hypothetical protein
MVKVPFCIISGVALFGDLLDGMTNAPQWPRLASASRPINQSWIPANAFGLGYVRDGVQVAELSKLVFTPVTVSIRAFFMTMGGSINSGSVACGSLETSSGPVSPWLRSFQ